MKRINWKEGKIFSLRLRNGKYSLMQMLERKGYVAVFDLFKDFDKWEDENINIDSILFICIIHSKGIFKHSEIKVHKNIAPVKNIEMPIYFINSGYGSRVIKLWVNTSQEREIILLGEGKNLLKREVWDYPNNSTYESIQLSDYEKFHEYELENLRIYPEFNERLFLCSLLNKNYDPLKELAFDRKLPEECLIYADIIGGKVLLNNLGY